MFDTLVGTVEILSPQERLIMILSDLECYQNMQLLNDLLLSGRSVTEPNKASDFDAALSMLDDILFTDYHALVRKDERLNPYQIGILSCLNRVYVKQFLEPDWEIKSHHKAAFEKEKALLLAKLDEINNE